MVNKYTTRCEVCGNEIPPYGGTIKKVGRHWVAKHLACAAADAPMVDEYYFPSTGQRMTRNKNGICEDAPCCGCCTV